MTRGEELRGDLKYQVALYKTINLSLDIYVKSRESEAASNSYQ